MVKWGYQTNGWWKLPLRQCLTDISEAGFEGIEIMSWHVGVIEQVRSVWGTIDAFRREMEDKGLKLAAVYWYGNKLFIPERRDDIVKEAGLAAAFLNKCGCDILNVDTMQRSFLKKGDEIGKEVVEDRYLKAIAECLNEVGRVTLESNVKTVVHQHLNAVIENRKEIDRFMEFTDPRYVGLCPDTGQLDISGVDPVDLIRAYGKRIPFVHLKDSGGAWKLGPREWIHGAEWPIMESAKDLFIWERERHFLDLGTGNVDLKGVMTALKEINYNGWIVVEDDGTLDPRKAAQDNRKYIDTVLRKIYG